MFFKEKRRNLLSGVITSVFLMTLVGYAVAVGVLKNKKKVAIKVMKPGIKKYIQADTKILLKSINNKFPVLAGMIIALHRLRVCPPAG